MWASGCGGFERGGLSSGAVPRFAAHLHHYGAGAGDGHQDAVHADRPQHHGHHAGYLQPQQRRHEAGSGREDRSGDYRFQKVPQGEGKGENGALKV